MEFHFPRLAVQNRFFHLWNIYSETPVSLDEESLLCLSKSLDTFTLKFNIVFFHPLILQRVFSPEKLNLLNH